MQSRWRSKTAWMSVISLVLFVLKTYFEIDLKEADKLIELTLICASCLGIFNNPTDKQNY
jgi:uncharacterized membrane protein